MQKSPVFLQAIVDLFLCSTVVTKPSLACYAQEVVVEIGDNERGRFKIRWIWEDFPPQNIEAQLAPGAHLPIRRKNNVVWVIVK